MPLLSFGYVPGDVRPQPGKAREESTMQDETYGGKSLGPALHHLYSLRPQTLAFSLCDSPVGLLAALLDVIHTRDVPQRPFSARSRSPFLSPVELEMQQGDEEQEDQEDVPSNTGLPQDRPPGKDAGDGKCYTWSPTEVLNFTMLQWLPGPEAVSKLLWCVIPLRVLRFKASKRVSTAAR